MTTIVFTYLKDGKLRVLTRVINVESVDEVIHVIDQVSLTQNKQTYSLAAKASLLHSDDRQFESDQVYMADNVCEECLDDITTITNLFTSAAIHHKDNPMDESMHLSKKCKECGMVKVINLIP